MRGDDDRLYAEFGLDLPDQKRCRRIDDGDRNQRVAKFDCTANTNCGIDARCIWIDDGSAASLDPVDDLLYRLGLDEP